MSEVRHGKALIDASRPFAVESRAKSWWYVASTLSVIAVLIAVAVAAPWWPLRLTASVLGGLVMVRGFILYHDYWHGSILKGSALAKAILSVYGVLVLTPPRVWKQTHNYHHANNAKIVGSHVGSYPMLTLDMWKKATPLQRFVYAFIRHPLTIAFGYFFIFLYGMCISGFMRRPEKNWDSALAFVLHFALAFAIGWYAGVDVMFFGFLLPIMVATGMGAYLFYAQHNFEGMRLKPRDKWSYTDAAIESSSYMKTGPIMAWLTGNIGYHHVHHLNPGIPFYRLPEAHEQIPELKAAKVTSLWPDDIEACFRLKIWDPERGEMVGFPTE